MNNVPTYPWAVKNGITAGSLAGGPDNNRNDAANIPRGPCGDRNHGTELGEFEEAGARRWRGVASRKANRRPPCENTRMYGLTVSDGVRELWSVIDGDPPDPVTMIRIFVVPTGWTMESVSRQGFAAIAPGRGYLLFPDVYAGSASRIRDEAPTLTFTLADLASLRPNEVWAVRTPAATPEAMTREQFHRASAATCDS